MAQPGYEGWGALGDAVVGGAGRRAEEKYLPRLKQNFDAFGALEAARIKRAQALARESLPAAVASSGIQHPDLAAAILGAAPGQPNLSTYTSGLQDLGDIAIQGEQLEAARAGDIDRVNLLNAVAADKVMDRTKIAGGVAYDPLAGPSQVIVPTPVGAADIAYKGDLGDAALTRAGAAAAEDVAHAGVYSAQAASGGWKPGKVTDEADKQARMAFILAEGTRLAKARGNEWADAWVNNELAKAGFDVQPLGGALAEDGSTALRPPAVRTPATRAWSQPEIQQAINDARRAIKSRKISREAAQKRLRDAGLGNAAEVI